MKFVNPVLIVKDKRRAFDFYRDVIGLRLVADFGDYVTLSCGVTLRSEDSWRKMNGFNADSIVYGNAAELFFEEEAFDELLARIEASDAACLVPPSEHEWGQRYVRVLDPDGHVVEIAEDMGAVCERFLKMGMSETEVSVRMDVPIAYVQKMTRFKR